MFDEFPSLGEPVRKFPIPDTLKRVFLGPIAGKMASEFLAKWAKIGTFTSSILRIDQNSVDMATDETPILP